MIARIVGVLVALVVLFFGLMMAASELGTEVVVLHTADEQGADHTTSLWLVESDGALWLRSGMPTSSWFVRLRAHPDVELERSGERLLLRATPVPEERDRIHRLMRERYGWADAVVSAMRDGSESVPVRLDPR